MIGCPAQVFRIMYINTDAKKELRSSGLHRRLSLESLYVYSLEQRVLGSAVWAGKGNSDDIASVQLLWRGSEHEASHWLSDKGKHYQAIQDQMTFGFWCLGWELRYEKRLEVCFETKNVLRSVCSRACCSIGKLPIIHLLKIPTSSFHLELWNYLNLI